MSLISSVSPNGTISGPIPNALALAVVQTNSPETGGAVASLLPSAVTAVRTVPASSTNTTRSSLAPDSSSAVTAQLLAQNSESEQQVVVAPRGTLLSYGVVDGEDDRVLWSLRIQRGEIDPALAPVIAKVPLPAVPIATNDNVQTTTAAQTAATQTATAQNGIATSATTATTEQQAAVTFTATQSPTAESRLQTATTPATKKPSLTQARGTSAYQLADARQAPAVPSSFEAILS